MMVSMVVLIEFKRKRDEEAEMRREGLRASLGRVRNERGERESGIREGG